MTKLFQLKIDDTWHHFVIINKDLYIDGIKAEMSTLDKFRNKLPRWLVNFIWKDKYYLFID